MSSTGVQVMSSAGVQVMSSTGVQVMSSTGVQVMSSYQGTTLTQQTCLPLPIVCLPTKLVVTLNDHMHYSNSPHTFV